MLNLTKKEKNNLKWIAKQFQKIEDSKKYRQYISKDEILKCDLQEMKERYQCYYIENTDIIISIKKVPQKGGKIFEYAAQSYDFIKFLENNKKETTIIK